MKRRVVVLGVIFMAMAGCVKHPTRIELMTENARIREENKELRQGIMDLAKKYKALRGPFMDPESPVGKGK